MTDNGMTYNTTKYALGDIVTLFADTNFKAMIASIEFQLSGSIWFKLKYRDGRSYCELWMSECELDACQKLDD